ncbi:MAG TPA: cell division protein FtsL [Smithellaceae bacterium]|jgi:cell division protein FtsL|nr:cell division protein FtsL [Smithellaceae bacterium]
MQETANGQDVPRAPREKKAFFGIKYPTFIIMAIVLMFVALIYVGSHIHMTELEYEYAAQMNTNQKLLEEQKKLKVEYAMLKSPQRIESIARDRLQMSYPEQEQIIVLKNSGE